jgi:hypothetical protein
MASKKEYIIQINGLTESIKSVDALDSRLRDLDKTINNLKAKKVDIPISIGKDIEKLGKSVTDIKNLTKAQQDLAKAEVARKNALEAVNTELDGKNLAEYKKETQALVAAETKARNEAQGYANTLNGLKKHLKDLNSIKGDIDLGSEEYARVSNQIYQINSELKELEAAQGIYGRNVGNYFNDVMEVFDELGIGIGGVENELNSAGDAVDKLNNGISDLKSKIEGLDPNSSEWQEAVNKMNEYDKALQLTQQYLKQTANVQEGSMQKIKLSVNGVDYEFNGINRAIQGLMKQLQNMAAMGKTNTKEFRNMAEAVKNLREQTYWTTGQLNEMTKYETGIESLVGQFEGLAAAASVGKGISGLFGDTKEIDESINKMMSLMSVLNGLQKLEQQLATGEGIGAYFQTYNNAVNSVLDKLNLFKQSTDENGNATSRFSSIVESVKSSFSNFASTLKNIPNNIKNIVASFKNLNKETLSNAVATTRATVAQKALSIVQKTGAVAANVLGTALKAIPILALVSGITWLIDNFDKLGEWIDKLTGETNSLGKAWDKVTEIFMGVVNVVKNIVMPMLEAYMGAIGKVLKGDFSGAFEDIKKGATKSFDAVTKVSENYQKGAAAQRKKNNEKYQREQAELRAKELEAEIKLNEAKYGSDWKYTQRALKLYAEYFKKKREMLDKDAKDYKEKLNEIEVEEASNKRDVKDHFKEQAKQQRDNIIKLQRERENLILQGHMKELAENDRWRDEELKKEKLSAKEKEEILKTYAAKRMKILTDMRKDYISILETQDKERENIEQSNKVSSIGRNISNLDNSRNKERESGDLGKGKTVTKANVADIETESMVLSTKYSKENIDLYEEYYDEAMNAFQDYAIEELNAEKQYYAERANLQRQQLSAETEIQLTALDNQLMNEKKAAEEMLKNGSFGEFYDPDTLDKNSKDYQDKLKKNADTLENYNEYVANLQKNQNKRINEILTQQTEKEKQITQDALDNQQDALKNYFDSQVEEFKVGFKNIENIVKQTPLYQKDMFGFDTGLINPIATRKSLKLAVDVIGDEFTRASKLKDELDTQFRDGLISEEVYTKSNDELVGYLNSLYKSQQEAVEKSKQLVLDTIQNYSQFGGTLISILGNSLQQYADIVNQNIENELSQVEYALDIAQQAYDIAEERAEKHKDRINAIEDELSDARGARREALIDSLAAQQEAYLKDVAAKQEAEEKKNRLEAKQKQLEKKQRQADKKAKIQQAYINMFMSISNALATNPWFVGLAQSIIATTLGISQINSLKNTPIYEDGGVIEGKRHSQGGVKVLGGQAEVEGGEYITNRKSTANNLPLLEYINSQKRKLDESDLYNFFRKGNSISRLNGNIHKFADGGQLPIAQGQNLESTRQVVLVNQNDQPTVVSVVDIVNAQDRVNTVKVLSGLE